MFLTFVSAFLPFLFFLILFLKVKLSLSLLSAYFPPLPWQFILLVFDIFTYLSQLAVFTNFVLSLNSFQDILNIPIQLTSFI